MARSRRSRKRPYHQGHIPLDESRLQSRAWVEVGPGGEQYNVRLARPSPKSFTCPGCGGVVSGQREHVVAWPVEHLWGAQAATEARRHWHAGCWKQAR